ncbi:modulator of FtsH protease HflK [Candidatus Xenohaliotis californiensis]|uniref:Protein HflK n=1 Tax=Candidatus Xenohaliotis californiensis TaxID=84677 RepID=A0ABM9N6X4_9RICK|nr:modulator of FtsH protease HflK [Candidatus Xenohaliotis californiensis]
MLDNNPWSQQSPNGRKNTSYRRAWKNIDLGGLDKFIPNGFNKKFFLLGIFLLCFLWLATGFYSVQPNQEGVELRFGKYQLTTTSGLHYHFPSPIEKVLLVDVTTINHEEIGYRSGPSRDDLLAESLMLTGDENIVDINFEVQWRIKDAKKYLFNLRDDKRGITVKAAAESAMREAVGKNKISYIIEGIGRAAIAQESIAILQRTVDEYAMGVHIESVQMKKADPPARVIDAFRDVQTAKADKERTINEASAYKNEILPRVRGEAERIVNEAKAYKSQVVNASIGETERFLMLYEQYKQNKFVTKKRIYLETIENVLEGKEKLLLTNKNALLPLFSVNESMKGLR